MRYARALLLVLVLVGLAAPSLAKEAGSAHIRVARDGRGRPRTLQTAISHYLVAGGAQVDLVAAVHLGDATYYRALDRRFSGYEAVLYELILDVPKGQHTGGVEIPRDSGDASALSQFQLALCRLLGLKFQLYSVHYGAANFRHADLTASEFRAAMQKSGESPTGLLLRVLRMALESPDVLDDEALEQVDLVALLYRDPTPEEQRALRRALAGSFPRVEGLTAQIQGTTLIAGRNARAMEVLARELKAGRRRMAIFYGAGHMADLEKRLLRLPSARLVRREWLDAWTL